MTQPSAANDQPLRNKSILLTRPAGQSQAVRQSFESLGAEVAVHPVIQILPPHDFNELDDCLERLEQFDWLVLVSPNAARFFCERFGFKKGSLQTLRELKVAAIGSSTQQALRLESGQPDWTAALLPPTSNSESLGRELTKQAQGQRLLIPRVDRHSDTLTDILTESGIEFEQPLTYRHAQVDSADPKIQERLAAGEFDWVTVTSPAIAKASVELFGESLFKSQVASISARASEALKSLGHPAIIEAKNPNMESLIAAIVDFEKSCEQ